MRSIPARAGEPERSLRRLLPTQVYPRACGGAWLPYNPLTACTGLSPRVRGSRPVRRMGHSPLGSIPARAGEPRVVGFDDRGVGSIPARAGEPQIHAMASAGGRVYPRACGGAAELRYGTMASRGLSPRVRGSPVWHLPGDGYLRSIPARAGEPPRKRSALPPSTVYPRACGGA